MFEPLLTGEGIISLLTLATLEIVLGIDNVIFISILASRLPKDDQAKARLIGLSLALIIRIVLLSLIAYIVGMQKPLFSIYELDVSIRDIILFAGGTFLIYKSTIEIHGRLEGEDHVKQGKKQLTVLNAIFQIILLDIVFSFDSILTAVGLVDEIIIMVIAVIISMIVMILFARRISEFINEHPTIKMLALAFLLMIGVLLVVESFHQHIPKGYIYFSMAFSLLVELLNMRAHKKSKPVQLRTPFPTDEEKTDNQK